jgi:chemotaxis protein MotB
VSEGPEVIIIKKKAKGHGAHGAAWKVAYADFVTAMMALFMVLWLVSQTDKKIRKTISEYFRTGVFSGAPSILEGGLGIAGRGFVDAQNPKPENTSDRDDDDGNARFMRAAVTRALGRTGFKGLAEHVSVKATPEGTLLQIAEGRDDMIFDLSSADLKPPLIKLLAGLAPELAKLGEQLEIHGHTDARPFASSAGRTNWTLSFERADRARIELEKNGVPPGLIGGVFAHGSSQPIDPDPLSPLNRRLAIFARHARTAKGGPADKGAGSGKETGKPSEEGKGESGKGAENEKPAGEAVAENNKPSGEHGESAKAEGVKVEAAKAEGAKGAAEEKTVPARNAHAHTDVTHKK